MRHPDILRYLDGIETEQSIMFVTEPVEPLTNQLNQDPDKNLILWGLYKIANAIKFLNDDCNVVHGNIRVASIFTNKAGEWKLGGLELLCSLKEESPIILTFGGLVPDAQKYATPEVKKSGWTAIKDLSVNATDSYHLGCLVYEAYNHRFESTDSLLSQKGNIPISMQRIYTQLLNPVYHSRATAEMFLDEGLRPKGFFSNDFVKVNLFLENISIKEPNEKEIFFKQLDSHINSFPSDFAKYKILPELIKAFEFGSGGAKALSAIVKVGDHLSDEEYEAIMIEPIIRMFASPDRAIRISLLENMPKFISHMSNKMVTNQVFPNIATGFTDTVPIIREQTIKSILLIVPKLNDKIINYDLLKHLAKLQMDPEPGIRTNTTICLGKIAKYLNESTRKKVLVPAFTRSLRDGFHHARIAALMALNATSDYYDAQECAGKIVPAISMVLIDKEKIVRDQAFKVMNSFVSKIQEFANKMPDTAIMNTSTSEESSSPAAGMAGVLGGATKNLAGWAVSSIQSRFSSPSGEIGNPINSESSSVSPPLNEMPQKPITPKTNIDHSTMNIIESDDTSGWDDEDSIPFDFNQSENNTWNSFDQQEPSSAFSPPPIHNSVVSSFSSTTKAHGSMKLSHKSKTADLFSSTNDGNIEAFVTQITAETPTTATTSPRVSKEDRKAELERRREERRQRMAELREKKKSSGLAAPTATPTKLFFKRDDMNVDNNLELYQNWASLCRHSQTNIYVDLAETANISVHNLWKTVTQTVNCGGGHAITVTKTVAVVTATATVASQKPCTKQCWTDYIWHTYGDGISPAQGFTGVVSTMTWIGLINNEPAGGYPLGDVIYICVCAGLGLLGALLLAFFYQLGVICLACLGGFYFAKVARVCFIIGTSLVVPFFEYFIETYVVLFSTSLMGSYLFIFGIDFFAHTGFINAWLSIFDGNSLHRNTYMINQSVYIMLSFVIVCLIASFGWQYYYNIICLKLDGFGTNNKKLVPKEEEKAEETPPAYICVPPPSYYGPSPPQPMFVQNVSAPYYS
ncbi:uncharacterized protein BX663DRAFT_427236 [Cokeromyces recurvatus]|uniref:uncharacterized protein n=1 Tax=Cokeromyces recurvatus TaxID=90255 RepID=UPI00221FF0F9|nr:uncharacterized protein BX663DRAFT_427236 [Cokeromyces recurvatus]KAI7906564.1 hypothetical protein BX663DRAFT_427236 [Cokeromyces recurvatus]